MTENDICNQLIEYCDSYGINHSSETHEYDILLSTRNDLLIGVQAKINISYKEIIYAIHQLLRKDDVHFKIFLYNNLNVFEKDKVLDILYYLKIIAIRANGNILEIENKYGGWSWFLHFRQHPKKLAIFPDAKYKIDAGVKAPKRVTSKNVALVKLELISRTNNGYVSHYDAVSVGLYKMPTRYFSYDYEKKLWKIRTNNLPSKQFPHIESGLLETMKVKI